MHQDERLRKDILAEVAHKHGVSISEIQLILSPASVAGASSAVKDTSAAHAPADQKSATGSTPNALLKKPVSNAAAPPLRRDKTVDAAEKDCLNNVNICHS